MPHKKKYHIAEKDDMWRQAGSATNRCNSKLKMVGNIRSVYGSEIDETYRWTVTNN